MKFFGGIAPPTDLVTTLTTTVALAGNFGHAARETYRDVSDYARSKFKRSELVNRVRLFGGASFFTILGPAVCADMFLRPSKYDDVPRRDAMKMWLKASLTIGPRGMIESVGDGAKLAARGAVFYITSRNAWANHIINNPLAVFKIWDMLAASALEEVTRMLNDYASLRMLEYEETHRTEGT